MSGEPLISPPSLAAFASFHRFNPPHLLSFFPSTPPLLSALLSTRDADHRHPPPFQLRQPAKTFLLTSKISSSCSTPPPFAAHRPGPREGVIGRPAAPDDQARHPSEDAIRLLHSPTFRRRARVLSHDQLVKVASCVMVVRLQTAPTRPPKMIL